MTSEKHRNNWKYVTEFFFISFSAFLGVFFGLLADRFVEAQRNHEEEKRYIERLDGDLALSIESTNKNIDFMKRQAEYLQTILEVLRSEKCKNIVLNDKQKRDFANGFYHIGKLVNYPTLFTGTIDEMISTGKMHVITNEKIRKEIFELFSTIQGVKAIDTLKNLRHSRPIIHVESRIEFRIETPIKWIDDIKPNMVKFELKNLCEDTEFRAALSASQYHTNGTIDFVENRLTDLQYLKTLVEKQRVN